MQICRDKKLFFFSSCGDDYIRITDITGTYEYCGYRKYTLENTLCSSAVYIQYKSPADLSSIYRGMRIYYECE